MNATDITNDPTFTLPTTITNGISHHFSAGDEIKYYPSGGGCVYYGDVVKICPKSIKIELKNYNGPMLYVSPRELNFD